MCFRFSSCFNGGETKDDFGPPSTSPKAVTSADYHGNDRKAPTNYGHLPAAVDEAGRKVYYYDTQRDGHGHGYAQDRAYGGYVYPAADEASKLAARNNKVGDYHAGYRARVHVAAGERHGLPHRES